MTEQMKCCRLEDPAYPRRLQPLEDKPRLLYGYGRLPKEHLPSLAVVGARNCSVYGRNMAYEFSRVLGGMGIQIVSGMAAGVDSAAHEGALAAGADTFAVLGCGADVCYPASARRLYERLKQAGGVWSEFPPKDPPLAWHFPRRNRLISGLADAVLVVEARQKSGSLITVDCALEQGRTVFAVPGRVGDALSEGCNRLIAQGASVAWSPQAILDEMGWNGKIPQKTRTVGENPGLGLATADKLVYSCLDLDPKTLSQIQQETGLPIGELAGALLRLQLMGAAEEIWKNTYVKGTNRVCPEASGPEHEKNKNGKYRSK